MCITSIKPTKTGQVTDHLFAVRTGTVNFFIYKSDEDLICFDSGFNKKRILRELKGLGMDPKSVSHLFLTHSDFDHAGGLSLFAKAKIYLSSDEEQLITGRKARMLGFIYNSRIKRPYRLLKDNEVVEIGSTRIRAISTPGHTAGSMSYFVNESILLVGDAFKLIDHKVYPKRWYFNMNTEQQKGSIGKLARLENVHLACTAQNGYIKEFDEAIRNWK